MGGAKLTQNIVEWLMSGGGCQEVVAWIFVTAVGGLRQEGLLVMHGTGDSGKGRSNKPGPFILSTSMPSVNLVPEIPSPGCGGIKYTSYSHFTDEKSQEAQKLK